VWQVMSDKKDLRGIRIALQGLGHVGFDFASKLVEAGATVVASDINPGACARAKNQFGAEIIDNSAIASMPCDVFAPCARGAVLNERSIAMLRCKAVVGCSNNQLETPEDGERLWKKNILYAPDFVVNAGGIMNIFVEYEGYDVTRAFRMARGIYDTTLLILPRAAEQNVPPVVIAERMAEEKIHGESRTR
jgi:leucine dehydrogenase